MEAPGTFSKTCLAGTSSKVVESSTTITSSDNGPFDPLHRILKASLADPSALFRLVTVVVRVPSAYFGVSTVYATKPVPGSSMVVLRISSSSFGAKDRFMLVACRSLWRRA